MKLCEMSKEQLIKLVQDLTDEKGMSEDEFEKLEEEAFRSEAFMESHGRIDYGYGIGAYGPL